MNIFKQISEQVSEISERQYQKIRQKFEPVKKENEYWAKLEKDADCWAKFTNNPEYPVIRKFLQETISQLDRILKLVLSGNFKDYTREERADKAAIIAAQISMVEYLLNEPERIIEDLRQKTK